MNYQAESECQFNVLKLFSFCAQTKRCQQETEKARKNEAERFQSEPQAQYPKGQRSTAVWDKATTSSGNRERVAVDFQKGKVRDRMFQPT